MRTAIAAVLAASLPAFGSVPGDCNCNGILDDDEIAQGLADDTDGNGVPDECELYVACSAADVTTIGAGVGDPFYGVPDGVISAADLQLVVNHWLAGELCFGDWTTQGVGQWDPGYGVPDGLTTAADLNYFVNAWAYGCP